MSPIGMPCPGTTGQPRPSSNVSPALYSLPPIRAPQQPLSPAAQGNGISSPTPVQFTTPPPQLFYWPYPSPPISPQNTFYTNLPNGPNLLPNPIFTQSGIQMQQAAALGAVTVASLAPHPIPHSPISNPEINSLMVTPPTAAMEATTVKVSR